MRDTIAAGEIGDVKIVRSELLYTITDWANDSRVRRDLAGGALLDAGCYCVDLIRTIMGEEPLSVSAFEHIKPSHGVDTTFAGLLRFPDDRIAYMATGMEQPFRFTLEVVGTDGSLHTDNVFATTQAVVVQGERQRIVNFESSIASRSSWNMSPTAFCTIGRPAFQQTTAFTTQRHSWRCVKRRGPVVFWTFAPEVQSQGTRISRMLSDWTRHQVTVY